MFNGGVPEKVIAENSGHKSMKALRQYEHTSQDQFRAATECVNVDFKPNVTENPVENSVGKVPGLSGNFSNCSITITLS